MTGQVKTRRIDKGTFMRTCTCMYVDFQVFDNRACTTPAVQGDQSLVNSAKCSGIEVKIHKPI